MGNNGSQCYKSFTDLYLQVCKNRPTFKIICGHKCCLFQKYHAFQLKNLVFKSENKHQKIKFDNTWGDIFVFKNKTNFTDL